MSVCRALPAHVSVSLHIPVVLSIADQLKEQVSVPTNKQDVCSCRCKCYTIHKGAVLPRRRLAFHCKLVITLESANLYGDLTL